MVWRLVSCGSHAWARGREGGFGYQKYVLTWLFKVNGVSDKVPRGTPFGKEVVM